MANCVPERIIGFLGQIQISVAPIQRAVVWNSKKVKDIYDNLIKDPIFWGNIYSREITDEFDTPMQLIYDGLQRTSTLLLFWKVLFDDVKDSFTERYKPAKLLFSNKNLQLDWDDIQLNNFKRKSILYKNYMTIKNAFNSEKKEIQDLLRNNFKKSTWYCLNIPDSVNPNEFYVTINSKGTLMSIVDIVRGFYPENNYQDYNNIMQNFKDSEQRLFLKDIANLSMSNKAFNIDVLGVFESDERPSLEDLRKYANAYSKMLEFCKNLVGKFLPMEAKIYFSELDLSSLPDDEKNQKRDMMYDFLCLVQYLPNGGLSNNTFRQVFHTLTIDSSIDDLKIYFKKFLKSMKNLISTDIFQSLKDALKDLKYKKNNSKNNLNIIQTLKLLDKILFNNEYTRDNIKWTVEHIKAQSSNEEWVNNFGNLVLLNRPNNSRVGGDAKKMKGIDEKIYTNSGCRLTEYAYTKLKEANFSEKAINDLGDEYAEKLIHYLKQLSDWED